RRPRQHRVPHLHRNPHDRADAGRAGFSRLGLRAQRPGPGRAAGRSDGRDRVPGRPGLQPGDRQRADAGRRMDSRMKTAPRAQDVADLAQVSQSAVSRTFTPGASVSEATRRKVLAAAQKLGYRPNALARSLITRRSRIVALVMSYLENQFYPLVIEQLSQKLQKEGYHVLMFIAEVDEAADGVLAEILQYQVDGIVMASAMLSSNVASSCAAVALPVV